jgi:hypothetical protein
VTYKINGKQYTEFDINNRCAEIMNVDAHIVEWAFGWVILHVQKGRLVHYEPCANPADAWPIIENCFDNLMEQVEVHEPQHERDWGAESDRWSALILRHNCTRLIAICICLIESNEK